MVKTTFIYALCEPDSHTVRYIGKSNTPKRRLTEHRRASSKHRSHLGNWLRSLNGVPPELIVLREVSVDGWEVAEERYIRLARGCGISLVNSTDGGEGITNPSDEVRDKMRSAWLGKKHSAETITKMRASHAQRTYPTPSEEHKKNLSKALKKLWALRRCGLAKARRARGKSKPI